MMGLDPNSEGTQELKFTIKETVCPVEEGRALEECDFKEDGVVRECTGNYFLGEKPPLAFVTCDAVEGIEEEEEVEEEKEKKDEDEEEDRSRLRKLRRRPFRRVRVTVTIKIVIKF
ncbi:cathelicidin-related peptide Oh-Cath-like [Crotalus adamanteus]|uniref:Cathelicidin-related antimicrobial peptide n=1 Tax=Crotalus adamanteus TaxID=8729 RepID=A0AAW1B2X4_CROAD